MVSLIVVTGCDRAQPDGGAPVAGKQQALSIAAPAKTTTAKRVAWVLMKDRGNLTHARATRDWKARGQAVQSELTSVASSSQASIRSFLSQRGAKVKSFWIANALRVEADQATIDALSKRADVAKVLPDRSFSIPPPQKGTQSGVTAVEWGLSNIRAPEVWSTFGIKGDGVVVANIDTGVQFDHPALQRQYRGTQPGGVYDHNYNWFDPALICGAPSNGPCDNAGHGTHTMGTMVGDDGDPGDNQIGVAPHARWIAAKGCEDFSCSLDSLLSSAQWVLAPTDLNGQNPRPDLRPQVINNSWGGPGGDPFLEDAVTAWVAAGMFPAFAAGNSGPGCGSVGSPGDYPETYAVGAYDINNDIAFFSSRGPSSFGVGKPNIAAPGVGVRSSVPFDSYDIFDGTSMATPHLAGTVALMWSAAPSLFGDVAATRTLLDQSAVDTEDLSCGGDPGNNFVWGEGRLDAFTAVDLSPRGPTGTLHGLVTAAGSAAPIPGATITAHPAMDRDRTTTSDTDGSYSMLLAVGAYDVSVQAFGYLGQSASGVNINQDATTEQNFALALAPSHLVSGTVRDAHGSPLAGVTVTVLGTPIVPVTTDVNGNYSIAGVPEGEYQARASAGHCYDDETLPLIVTGTTTLDFSLATRVDAYGYSCVPGTYSFLPGNTVIAQSGDDDAFAVNLPFPFTYYGQTYSSVNVGINGEVHFITGQLGTSSPYFNTTIPDAADPNAAIYPFWDDLFLDGTGSILTDVVGSAPNRQFIIEWRDVKFFGDLSQSVTFEVVLYETGQVLLQYATNGSTAQQGGSATIGIENEVGSVGLQYSFNEPSIAAGTAIFYTLPPSGIVRGTVTDHNDGQPIAGAMVRVMDGATQVRAATTDAAGQYQLQVPVGSYTLEASRDRYATQQRTISIAQDQFLTADFSLATARATVTPATIQLLVPSNQTRTRVLTLGNTGSASLDWSISEAGGQRQATVASARLPRSPADTKAKDTRKLFGNTTPPSGWSPMAPGDVLASFTPTGMNLAWGVGYDSNVWLSDVMSLRNVAFSTDGTPTGTSWPTSWASAWPADMAYDANRGVMCQVNVGGDNGIYCWNPASGSVTASITGSFPWTGTSQRGIAYRDDDDTFYIGGWNEGIIYHVKGLSYPDKGAVISSCMPSDGSISGLAWNGSMGVLWEATNSPTDTIYELNPDDCTVLSTLAHPQTGGFVGAGLEMDESGNLWTIAQSPNRAYLIDSGVPAFSDVPWLSATPASGTLAAGQTTSVTVTVDTTGLTPGVYLASLFVRSNSGRENRIRIPVSLIVSAYQQAVDAGGAAYTDTLGDPWAADRAYTSGSWGYVQKSKTATTTKAISGTPDPTLFKSQRIDPYAYRFDNVPNGVYQVDLRFAELNNKEKLGQRLFDVIVEDTTVLPAHDIVYQVGALAADSYTFFVPVADGRMDVRLVLRAKSDPPVVNALRITHRPDR